MADNDDFFGGMFDFDGDGKTGPDEIITGHDMLEENEKVSEGRKRPAAVSKNAVGTGEKKTSGDVGATVLAGLIVCFVTGLFLYGAICAYEPGSGVSFAFVLITALVFVTALVFSVKMIAESISKKGK